MITRRDFPKLSGAGIFSLYAASHGKFSKPVFAVPVPGAHWHCHIVEHEDNEMMRPYRIGP